MTNKVFTRPVLWNKNGEVLRDFQSTFNGEDRFKLASKSRPRQVVSGCILHGNDSDCNPLALNIRGRS